jgi:hypothetical protein
MQNVTRARVYRQGNTQSVVRISRGRHTVGGVGARAAVGGDRMLVIGGG